MSKNNDEEYRSFSERFDKKYLLLTLAALLLLGVSIFFLVRFIHDTVLSVVFAFVTLGAAVLLVVFYKKAIRSGTWEEGLYLIFLALGKFFTFILKPIVKLLQKLGFLKDRMGGSRDEHSFIFDFGRKGAGKRVKPPKWKDLTDNAQRVRFIFTKQMNFRIKKGYRFKKNMTPSQIEKDLKPFLKEDEDLGLLFDSYRLARYENAERAQLDDKLIDRLRELY